VVSGLLWTAIAGLAGVNAAPVALALTGLLCGLALRLGSGNQSGAAYALLAVGCTLLGMFIGEAGQAVAIQKISFANYHLAALVAGIVCAALIGGLGSSAETSQRQRMA
jgi:hypothetical protein